MTEVDDQAWPAARFRCPTCRAEQPWSDTCRRCKCDLSLLHRAAQACQAQYRLCLQELSAGRTAAALAAARQCYAIKPTPAAARLLAVSALVERDWATAVAAGRHAQGGAEVQIGETSK